MMKRFLALLTALMLLVPPALAEVSITITDPDGEEVSMQILESEAETQEEEPAQTAPADTSARTAFIDDIISLATGGIRDYIKLHPEKRQECTRDIRHLNAQKIGEEEADLNKLRNIFMAILKDIKADYGTEPQDMSQNIFQEQYEIIKAKRNEIKEERELTEDDMAKITTEMLIESGTLDMDKTEQQLFFELFKHILKRTAATKKYR